MLRPSKLQVADAVATACTLTSALGYALSIHDLESKTANGSVDEVIDRMNDDIPSDVRESLLQLKQQTGYDMLAMMSVNWKKNAAGPWTAMVLMFVAFLCGILSLKTESKRARIVAFVSTSIAFVYFVRVSATVSVSFMDGSTPAMEVPIITLFRWPSAFHVASTSIQLALLLFAYRKILPTAKRHPVAIATLACTLASAIGYAIRIQHIEAKYRKISNLVKDSTIDEMDDDQSIVRDPRRKDVEFSAVLNYIYSVKNEIEHQEFIINNWNNWNPNNDPLLDQRRERVNQMKNGRVVDFKKDATGPWIAAFSTFVSFACILLSLSKNTHTHTARIGAFVFSLIGFIYFSGVSETATTQRAQYSHNDWDRLPGLFEEYRWTESMLAIFDRNNGNVKFQWYNILHIISTSLQLILLTASLSTFVSVSVKLRDRSSKN